LTETENRYMIEKRARAALEQLKSVREPKEAEWKRLQLHADGRVPISPKTPHQAKSQTSQLSITGYRLARHVQRIYTDTEARMRFATNSPIMGEDVQSSLKLLVEYWLNENKFRRMLPKIVKSAYFSSYYVLRVFPDPMFKRRPVVTEVPALKDVVPRGFGYEVSYQMVPGIRISHISPYDFWVSNDGALRVCRYVMSPQQFLEYASGYLKAAGIDISDIVKELELNRPKADDSIQGLEPTARDEALGLTNVYYAGGAPVQLFHFEGNISGLTGDNEHVGAAMTLVQIKGGRLRMIEPPAPRPYWDGSASDYVYGTPFIEDFTPYPRSLFSDYRPYAQHQAELYNLVLDGTGIRVMPPHELDPRLWGDPKHPGPSTRYLWPGRPLLNTRIGEGRKVAEYMKIPEMPPSVLQVYEGIDRKLQELTVNELTQGLPTAKGRPTATELSLKSGYTNENRLDYVETIEESLIEPLILKLVALIAQFQYDFTSDPDMLQLLGEKRCHQLDQLKTDERIKIAQATRSIGVTAMAETARSQDNLQALMALLGAISKLPKEALEMVATKKTKIDLAEFVALALDSMPFDTTKLVSYEQEAPPNLIEQVMRAREASGGMEELTKSVVSGAMV